MFFIFTINYVLYSLCTVQENKNSSTSLIKSLRKREGAKPKQITIIDDGEEEEEESNNICDDSKQNTTVIEQKIKHSEEEVKRNLFSADPSTSTAYKSAKKKDEPPIEIVDESNNDELCVPSIIPRFTTPKCVKIMNKSCIDNGSEENDGHYKCIAEATASTTTDKIIHTQKLSDEELGIQNEIPSDVNSVYRDSDIESMSLLAFFTEHERDLNGEFN